MAPVDDHLHQPGMPELKDYYEPWTYDYDNLISAPLGEHTPVARPKPLITGKPMKIEWSANWDDDSWRRPELSDDPVIKKIKNEVGDRVKMEFEQAFMFYLPRICEHCLNPHVWRARPVRCTSAARTALCWSTRTPAAGGACV